MGRTDMEDGLERLDKLTLEEARMATAEVLTAMHVVHDRVVGVDERVKAVDEKVAVVIHGAQSFHSQSTEIYSTLICLDGNEAKVVIQQTANDVDQVKRT
jgi:hypothetical protein